MKFEISCVWTRECRSSKVFWEARSSRMLGMEKEEDFKTMRKNDSKLYLWKLLIWFGKYLPKVMKLTKLAHIKPMLISRESKLWEKLSFLCFRLLNLEVFKHWYTWARALMMGLRWDWSFVIITCRTMFLTTINSILWAMSKCDISL